MDGGAGGVELGAGAGSVGVGRAKGKAWMYVGGKGHGKDCKE